VTASPERSARSLGGFTLIEIMAVVLILLLLAGIALPRLSLVTGQTALGDARRLAATLDFTREKALAIGRAHRVVVDLDHGQYWIEAQPPPAEAEPTLTWAKQDPLPLVAPQTDARTFAPLPGRTPTPLDANVRFAGVASDAGDASEGLAQIVFTPEGATPATSLWLAAGEKLRVRVDVAPFADPTRVTIDESPQ
jgi:prepilin-type N-terminal cleavage/methylation domain-containing protein